METLEELCEELIKVQKDLILELQINKAILENDFNWYGDLT